MVLTVVAEITVDIFLRLTTGAAKQGTYRYEHTMHTCGFQLNNCLLDLSSRRN